jgi:pSer/pThr/pTyr-binding forkhead associated (FHA) protein
MTADVHDTGPSLFEDLAAGLAALDGRATLRLTVDVTGRRSELSSPADGGRLLIGRADDADVVVSVPQASRRHAELRTTAGRVWCHDARSSYGTWVERDGRRFVTPLDLTAGDRIVTAGGVILLEIVELQ